MPTDRGLTGRRAAVSIKAMLPVSNGGAGPAARTKADFIEELARITELPRKEAANIIEHILASIVRAIRRGDKVEIRGFGSFRFRNRAPRKGRNPKTGEKVDVPPKKIPYFKMGKELKALLNAPSPDGVGAGPAEA